MASGQGQGPGPGQGPDTPGTVHSPAGQSLGSGPGPDDDSMSLKRDADMVNPSSPATNDESAKRRKKSGPGSRGVANLTPEQLAKKRANGKSTVCLLLFAFCSFLAYQPPISLSSQSTADADQFSSPLLSPLAID